eukprot:1747557-Rhodomonas_salina.3
MELDERRESKEWTLMTAMNLQSVYRLFSSTMPDSALELAVAGCLNDVHDEVRIAISNGSNFDLASCKFRGVPYFRGTMQRL